MFIRKVRTAIVTGTAE